MGSYETFRDKATAPFGRRARRVPGRLLVVQRLQKCELSVQGGLQLEYLQIPQKVAAAMGGSWTDLEEDGPG